MASPDSPQYQQLCGKSSSFKLTLIVVAIMGLVLLALTTMSGVTLQVILLQKSVIEFCRATSPSGRWVLSLRHGDPMYYTEKNVVVFVQKPGHSEAMRVLTFELHGSGPTISTASCALTWETAAGKEIAVLNTTGGPGLEGGVVRIDVDNAYHRAFFHRLVLASGGALALGLLGLAAWLIVRGRRGEPGKGTEPPIAPVQQPS